jgi:outer membrane protein assembly factor BamB
MLGDNILVTGGSRLFSLKSTKGVNWYEPLDGQIEGGAKVAGDRIYASTTSNGLFAIDPKAGKRTLWRYEALDRIGGTPGVSADGATVFVGTNDRYLHAVRASNGDFLWKREMPADVRVEPLALEGGIMIVACSDGTIVALKGSRPEDEVWKYRMDGAPGPMTLDQGILLIPGSDNTIHAIDPLKGTKFWNRVLPTLVTGRIGCSGGTVVAALREGRVHFLNAATGATLWTVDDQFVYAYDLSLRSLAWKLKVKGKVKLAPAVGKGMAFIANDEGVYAVELN